ncbi:MAG: hypothetical protein KDN19_18945 [Verrucomicrobiae bacterium]|nr:hypothetical protein [Verrucomicrobiae bacterium]
MEAFLIESLAMKTKSIQKLLILVAMLPLASCASRVVPKPGAITLEAALDSVGRGLVSMKQAQLQQNNGEDFTTGLLPSEAEVTFNVVASGKDSGKLYVELTPPATAGFGGKAGGEASSEYVASRGNQITIKFRSIAFSKTTKTKDAVTIEGPTDPETLKALMGALKDSGIHPYLVLPPAEAELPTE